MSNLDSDPNAHTQSQAVSPDEVALDTPAVVTGAENVRFNLSDIYSGLEDPQIQLDIREIEESLQGFDSEFRGNLATRLGDSIEALAAIQRVYDKVSSYLFLMKSCDVGNQQIKAVRSNMSERISRAWGEHVSFFEIEIGTIEDTVYEHLLETDQRVSFHEPLLRQIRKEAVHLLSEPVERALTIRAPFGPSELNEFYRERLAEVRFTPPTNPGAESKDLISLEEILNILNEDPDRDRRAQALESLNEGLKQHITPIAVQTFNAIIGLKGVDDKERKFDYPMASQNLSNKVSDEVVDALHDAVKTKGAQLAQRFYKLLAKRLGVETLLWSDRNTPLSASTTIVPWDEAVRLVHESYSSFSPTMAELFKKMIDNGWIDAPHYKNKETGAFNLSMVMPAPLGPRSYNLLNYFGTLRDVQVLAHESGHGIHGLLAGEKQGVLMADAPIAYSETASIFSEMVTFNFILDKISSPEEKLNLLMDKAKDLLNTVVRQISFSEFEKRIHDDRKNGKLTTEQYVQHWKDVTREMYGEDGEVFEYKNIDHLWSYVSHFSRPFYVYGYAFGELFVQSLYAVKDSFGDSFEPLYLDLLRAGGTKDATELLAPFNLDPTNPEFWAKGLEVSLEKWIEEAERLMEFISTETA